MEVNRKGIVRGWHTPEKREKAFQMRWNPTPAEAALWSRIRANQLGVHIRRQVVIDGFIVDFYCHAAGLVIEVDGGVHEANAEYDRERDKVLSRRGLRLLRF